MTDSMMHADWLPIRLPDDVVELRAMLVFEERVGLPGDAVAGPIRRKIERIGRQQDNKQQEETC